MLQRTNSAYSEHTIILIYLVYKTDFPTVNTLDMVFLMNETHVGNEEFICESVFYGGQHFPSIDLFIKAYRRGDIKKVKMNFPSPAPGETSMPSTMHLRGKTFPHNDQAGPKEYEPDGKRYRVKGQHIEYMEWSFNYRISTVSGPQVWDVRWSGQRIAYEISLQELAVFYAGDNPATFYTHLSDSAFGIGNRAYGLMPGVDCPEHATFLPVTFFDEGKSVTVANAFCVFEHNSGVPLRRHNSNLDFKNYGGLVDRVLVVRTIIVEYNYDYIFDMIFHQNGAIEVKTYATGYVMSHAFHEGDDRFGFKIANNIVGSIHHHLFNYKIDLDINGQANRYETLDLTLDKRKWPWYKSGQETFQQLSFSHTLKETELQAVYRYNFSTPKYHIVYNNQERNKFGAHRSYRMSVDGFSKVLFPDDSPMLSSRKWCKYQIAATHRKDEEESSSSIFSMFDGQSPHVDFDRFLQDNESLVDQVDLISSYGGLVDRVLVVRTIIVEFNYDYIFDIIFHQNGAVEIKTYASGFLMSHSFQNGDDKFGFRVAENIVGSIHHHLFHFKIDLDIKGQINRYETLDLALDERKWPWYKSGQETFQQLSFSHTLKETELQAVYRYNFSTPKYHIVYNNQERNKFGAHRSYRMSVDGFSKVLFPDDSPMLSSRKWCKYQIAATHRKDEEESSSSIFSMFDGQSPHVDFDRFLQDNESLVDQDLVFWVTVGVHHIPHTEDIPNTPTVGTQATISLMPYNYFPECPSVGSRDAVRADAIKDSVVFQDYNISLSSQCLPQTLNLTYLENDSSYLFP
uniref:Amine oxidase n=1 Tax=Biomphalaria glabrata TaxID=6526 RepID=A0A2C9JXY0_BIOGL